MNSKLEEDYQGIVNKMKIEAEKEREYLINEIICLKALSKLNEELEKNYCILRVEKKRNIKLATIKLEFLSQENFKIKN